MATYKNIPVSLKAGFAFLCIGLFLLSIIFMLFIPNMKQEQYEKALLQTNQVVRLTKHQILLVVDYFREYRLFERDKAKNEIEHALETMRLKASVDTRYALEALREDVARINQRFNCAIHIEEKGEKRLFLPNARVNKTFDFGSIPSHQWEIRNDTQSLCMSTSYTLYKTNLAGYDVHLSCNAVFDDNDKDIESNVKKIVQDGFSLTSNLHKGKIYLMWINTTMEEGMLHQRMDTLDNTNDQNYCISKISNVTSPQTGALQVNDILDVNETTYLRHILDEQPTLTWISRIYKNEKEAFVFIFSAYEKDFKDDLHMPVMKLVMISIMALLLSIFLGFLLFRTWIRNIEILSMTARNICLGKRTLRSNIKGKDDIGILGEAFDSMLDTLEDHLKNLDQKVEERTLALEESLKTKEMLLKEIHHRVKNNLSLTINFIKLQRYKIDNPQIQAVLGDIENRIYTMALLHTKLYESKNLDSIDMKKYIEELVFDIAHSYPLSHKIILHVNVEKITLAIDDALPCGLIINECVTNAIKHAFGEEGGVIEVSLVEESGHMVLCISDNGKGFSPQMPSLKEAKTLGLQLIHTIVTKQLFGTIVSHSEKGLRWEIAFGVSESENPKGLI